MDRNFGTLQVMISGCGELAFRWFGIDSPEVPPSNPCHADATACLLGQGDPGERFVVVPCLPGMGEDGVLALTSSHWAAAQEREWGQCISR